MCARDFSCAVRGFDQVLKSDPREKHGLLISVMAGYWPSFFFLRFRGQRHPGYQRFILACDDEVRRPRAEDTSGEAARENNVVPRVSRSMKTQKTTWPISSHYACQCACFSRRSFFKT